MRPLKEVIGTMGFGQVIALVALVLGVLLAVAVLPFTAMCVGILIVILAASRLVP